MSTPLNHARRASEAVLAVDLSDVRLHGRVPQVVVGWCRAAFAQIQAMASLVEAGIDSARGPNQRLLFELVVRLVWLTSLTADERRLAVDEMLEHERRGTQRTVETAQAMGMATDFSLEEMLAFQLQSSGKGRLFEEAKNFSVAATAGRAHVLYALWRETSGISHASGRLAASYAPAIDDSWIGSGEPELLDPDHYSLADMMLLVVEVTTSLLVEEEVDREDAERIMTAYLGV